ncbi:MAG: polymer-forming cytoskeletal protein [Firmicutes bacterium]|nr:polymer-forming cytoskeletal protein [Bacillota bacterium]
MFTRRQESQLVKGVDTVVGKDTEFEGKLVASGAVRIDGRLRGEIDTTGDLIIGEGGMVAAAVRAKNVVIAGHVEGNVVADGRLEIVPSGRLYGDVKVATLVIEDGAIFRGACEMTRPDSGEPKLLPGRVEDEGVDHEAPGSS